MKSRGFTLIELLAVIVILAIIALIAVPIVLNIINNSKEQSVKISAEHYIGAVEQAIAREYLKDSQANLDGIYGVEEQGEKLLQKDAATEQTPKEIKVEYDGEAVEGGSIKISDGKVISATNLKINKYYVTLESGEITLSTTAIEKAGLYKPDGTFISWEELTTGQNSIIPLSDNGKTITRVSYSSLEKLIGKLVIADEVTRIGAHAFYGCTLLTEVIIANSVTNIEVNAFAYTGLTSVTIPSSVINIVVGAFQSCSNLISINVDEKNNNYSSEDGVLYNIDKTNLVQYPAGKQDTNFTIPSSVTTISTYAFLNCKKLTKIEIPNSVTSIGTDAFRECSNLESVTIPNSVTSIANRAFYKCSNLNTVTIGSGVTIIDEDTFYACTNLTTLTIGNNVTSIGESAFQNCESLTSVTLPNSVTNIAERAFYKCTVLTEITIPSSVISIGQNAFYGCESLTATIQGSNATIESNAFKNVPTVYYAGYEEGVDYSSWSTGQVLPLQ